MTAPKKFRKGEKIFWKWLGREVHGKVNEVFTSATTVEIKGKKIKRNGSIDNPAYLVESEAGNLALKLHSELQKPTVRAKPTATATNRPRMFS